MPDDDEHEHEEGQALFAPEEEEVQNAAWEGDGRDQRPVECAPVGPTPPFELVSEFFERIADMRSKRPAGGASGTASKKRALIEQMFIKWRQEVGRDLYPLARLILPERDRYRATYGAKEQALAKIYVQVLGLARSSKSADALLKWKQPSKDNRASGDFAEVAFNEIEGRSTVQRSRLSIDEVNRLLDELSRENKQEGKARVLTRINDNLTARDQKWLIRIILKDLKISLGEKMVLSCIHQDAIDLFNVCSDLRAVCWKLWDPLKRLPTEDNTVQLFKAFRPMLCNRNKNDFEDIVKVMGSTKKAPKAFLIEEKLDGERIQLHKRQEEYRYFSRKDKNYTSLYGVDRTSRDGSLTPFIHKCFDAQVEEIILDGEMVAREPSTGLYLKFGTLKTTAINQWKTEGGPTVCYKVFDVLYAKVKGQPGRSLLDYPLSERRKVLTKLVTPEYARLEVAEYRTGTTAKDIKDRMAWILDKQGEGLVIKNLDSVYTLHGREDDWVKVKPEYMDSLGEEVDVLVMGGYWGSGTRGGTIGSFVCGVVDKGAAGGTRYLSFCKVGSGFSLEDFSAMGERLRGKAKEWVKGQKDPPGYVFGAEKPDVWYRPEDSFLVAVKAAEITADALNYGAEVCLRFPRVQKIRWDLSPEDCHEYQVDFLTLASSQKAEKTIADTFTKKRKIVSRNPKPKVLPMFQGADLAGLEEESNIFEDQLFYIIEGVYENGKQVEGQDKQALEKLVVANGGKRWSRVPKDRACHVICSRLDFMTVKNVAHNNDIIHPRWIIECALAKTLIPLCREYYVHLTPATDAQLAAISDEEEEEEEQAPPAARSKSKQAKKSNGKGKHPESRQSSIEPVVAKKTRLANGSKARTKVESEEELVTESDEPSTASDSDHPAGPSGKLATYRSPPAEAESDEEAPQDQPAASASASSIARSGMGAAVQEDQYDQEHIFRFLVFYLDTSGNAKKNGIATDGGDTLAANVAENDRRLAQAGKALVENGGKLVEDLSDPALTHIIVASDTRRLLELSRRTREPRARRIVTVNWVDDSVEMEGLQEETWYPAYAT